MPEPTVIVTFDVTEPHLQNCLDSLARQRDESRIEDTTRPMDVPDIEVVLVPVRAVGEATSTAPTVPEDPEGENTEPDTGGDDETAETDEQRPEENDQGDEAVDSAREDGLATARAFAAAPPTGLRVTLLDEDPAPHHPAARTRGAEVASGDHLLFLSGADALTGYALAHLAHSAADTRSELV
ncbi:CDP-glycerol glycerophosphotransferase family protein, partial [Nocardiopsis alba]